MNNDNDLNFHSMTKLSGWLRYWCQIIYPIALDSKFVSICLQFVSYNVLVLFRVMFII